MKNYLSFFLVALLILSPPQVNAEIAMGGLGGSGGGISLPVSILNGGTGQTTAPGAMGAISSGLIIDPRNYGATCAGAWYSITSSSLLAGGAGYNPGDTFLVEADGSSPYFGNHMRGGKVATGHVVTTGAGGAVVTYILDYAGTGYYAGSEATFATSGTGTGFQISYSVNSTPTTPTTSVASGGYNWAVGDNFYMPNSTGGNYMTARVSTIYASLATGITFSSHGSGYTPGTYALGFSGGGSGATQATGTYTVDGTNTVVSFVITTRGSYLTPPTVTFPSGGGTGAAFNTLSITLINTGAVATYTINNAGGDYAVNATASAYAIGGLGGGLKINISDVTGNASNGTWDDTYGLMSAGVDSAYTGGYVLAPDQCWMANMMPFNGATYFTPNIAPNYGYSDIETSGHLVYVSSPTHWFIYGTPDFGIDFNGQSALSLSGFEVRAYAPGSFGVTACMGSKHGGGLVDSSGIITPPIRLSHMSAKGCLVGLGTPTGAGTGYLDVFSYQGDYGANQYGIYGNFSDSIFDQDTIASADKGIWISASAGGLIRILAPRLEYLNEYGIELDTGGIQTQIIGAQTDRTGKAAIFVNNANQVSVIGGTFKGAGLIGSLKVTGAAKCAANTDVCLTVTGYGAAPSGGASATSGLVTGNTVQVANVTGTTEANGTWVLTVVDGSHIDLQGTTWSNAYVSGGLAGVNNNASYITLAGSASYDFHAEGATFAGYSAGAIIPASFVIESQGGTSTFDHISITGGSAVKASSGNAAGYMQSFANWQTTAPAHYQFDVPNNNPCRTDNTFFSINCATGSVGLGTATPNTVAALDMGAWTSAFILPTGTTGQEPTPTAGMCRYNSTTPGIECYYSSAWNTLGTGAGGVTSFTGDGVILNNSGSTGAVTATLATQTANTVLGALTATTPSDLPLPSCSGSTKALEYTLGTGFSCNSSITASNGGITRSVVPVTADPAPAGSVPLTDYVYNVTCNSGCNFTMPTAVGNLDSYKVKNQGTGTVTIQFTGGQTGDSLTTIPLTVQNQSLTLIPDGSNYNLY